MLDEQADIAYKNLVFEESVRQWVCPSPRDEGRPRTPRDLFLDARRHPRGRGGQRWAFHGGSVDIAEAPWSAAEWAVALLFVELLQAQLGRQVGYLI